MGEGEEWKKMGGKEGEEGEMGEGERVVIFYHPHLIFPFSDEFIKLPRASHVATLANIHKIRELVDLHDLQARQQESVAEQV